MVKGKHPQPLHFITGGDAELVVIVGIQSEFFVKLFILLQKQAQEPYNKACGWNEALEEDSFSLAQPRHTGQCTLDRLEG